MLWFQSILDLMSIVGGSSNLEGVLIKWTFPYKKGKSKKEFSWKKKTELWKIKAFATSIYHIFCATLFIYPIW